MKKTFLFAFVLSLTIETTLAQVAKKVIVEHFTNSSCSACGSRNPGFYTNLNKQTDVIHLAIHPSSPYPSCKINQHNKTENDDRTKYYGIYGSTPLLVINGTNISPSEDYSDAGLFTPFSSQTSPVSIKITQTKFDIDSIQVRVVIKTEATHTLTALQLFVALSEDTLFYKGSNSESVHYDVFRKSLTGASGKNIQLTNTIGDSLVFTASSSANSAWDFERINAIAILQVTSTKAVVQSEKVKSSLGVSTNIKNSETFEVNVFPNPVTNQLYINLNNTLKSKAQLFDMSGKLAYSQLFHGQLEINTSTILKGQYLLIIENESGKVSKTINKQ